MKSITILALLALILSSASASRYHSAKCLALRKKCSRKVARQSGFCAAGRFARNQSKRCHEAACSWCKVPGKASKYPCNLKNVRGICRAVNAGRRPRPYRPSGQNRSGSATRAPPTRPQPAPRPATKPSFQTGSGSAAPKAGCVYTGSNSVVVSLGKTSMASGWTRTSRAGMAGMVYKKDVGGGIDSARSSTTMCYKLKVSMAGDYLASAVSSAPHPTEHNDMWVSSSKGFKLIRGSKIKSEGSGKFLKAYQNNGGNKMSSEIYSIDHDPHMLIIPDVKAGEVITYCVSGRSSKYEVFKLMIAKCPSRLCLNGRPNTKGLMHSSSKCA